MAHVPNALIVNPNRIKAASVPELMPDVPVIAETLPGFEAVAWYAIVAPPQTPRAIVARINADVNEALAQPEIQAQLKKLSAEVFGGSVDRTAKYLRDEIDRWGAVIKSAKIEMQQ